MDCWYIVLIRLKVTAAFIRAFFLFNKGEQYEAKVTLNYDLQNLIGSSLS